MSTILADDRPTAKHRELADQQREGKRRKPSILKKGETPLLLSLDDLHQEWLLRYASDQWTLLHGSLDSWRTKLNKYEEFADSDYSSRIGPPDPDKTDAVRSVFEHQNYTLGLADGFCDFVTAQAKDDIFGISPWIAATPEGKADNDLAESVTRHIQWKFGQSNIEEAFMDAISLAVDLGTAFPRLRWDQVGESFEEIRVAAYSKASGQPLTGENGEPVTDMADIPEDLRGPDIEWREEVIERPSEIYRNVHAECLDFRNVAFDAEASELDLRKTDFFTKFTLGLHDLVAHYGLTEEQRGELIHQMNWEPEEEAREHREEEGHRWDNFRNAEGEANPPITLIEGFLRCDPTGSGNPIRIHIVFSPTLHVLFTADYLANITPGGILPVFPVRCFKKPRRIIGKGYREAAEDQNDAVDEQHNATVMRNRQAMDIYKGVNTEVLKNLGEGENFVNSPEKVWETKDGFDINDAFSFARLPDTNDRTIEIMNQHMQMGQMRFGISSAAQGELKGVPQAQTATGTKQLVSRGATLVKTPIDQMKRDLARAGEYGVYLTYANQNDDETFIWGEGETAELVEIKAGDVQGLRMNVKLTLTQAQNTEKLENAQVAMQVILNFSQMAPDQQFRFKSVLIQALKQLGFNEAEEMASGPIDPMALLEMVDPALQPYFQQALEMAQSEGVIGPPAPEGEAAE